MTQCFQRRKSARLREGSVPTSNKPTDPELLVKRPGDRSAGVLVVLNRSKGRVSETATSEVEVQVRGQSRKRINYSRHQVGKLKNKQKVKP